MPVLLGKLSPKKIISFVILQNFLRKYLNLVYLQKMENLQNESKKWSQSQMFD